MDGECSTENCSHFFLLFGAKTRYLQIILSALPSTTGYFTRPSTLSTGFGQAGILATSPAPYQTTSPGHDPLDNVILTPGIPVFSTETIYKISNGPHTADISVKFTQMVVAGPITIDVYAS
jgi:hypothetical protein